MPGPSSNRKGKSMHQATTPSIQRAESGVFGMYTIAAGAVVCSIAAGALLSGGQRSEVAAGAATVSAAVAPVSEPMAQVARVIEQTSANADKVGQSVEEEQTEYLRYQW